MDSSSSGAALSKDQLYSVRDPAKLMGKVLMMIPLTILALFVNYEFFLPDGHWLFLIGDIPLLVTGFRLKAIWKGVVVNVTEHTLTFPGGSVAANNFSDYVNPSYLLQSFQRFTIDLDQIGQISTGLSFQANSANVSSYNLEFVGTFGAASVGFSNEGKRDEIYSAIRQLNQMGTPINRA
jgi:hypothetical protein